jgi:acyl carrier protein
MDATQTETQIRQIMAEMLDVDPEVITTAFGRDDAPLWDSLNHLRLVSALEEAFGIKMTMREVSEMVTFEQIRSVISRHR